MLHNYLKYLALTFIVWPLPSAIMPNVTNFPGRHLALILALITGGIGLPFIIFAILSAPASPYIPFRTSPLYEQWAVVLAFFGIKLIYTILAAILIFILRRRYELDLASLRWCIIMFFVGEACCFVNVMGFHDQSLLFEHLHSVGMVLSLACGIHALIEGLDHRILHYSDTERCAFASLCPRCAKHTSAPCALHRCLLLLLPLLALTASLPLFSSFRDTAYTTRVLGATHFYQHPILHQIYELRFLPLAAMLLYSASLLVLWRSERHALASAKILFAAASGAISFSFFRLFLVASYSNNHVWFAVWEELLELFTIIAIGGVLYLFRHKLLPPDRKPEPMNA